MVTRTFLFIIKFFNPLQKCRGFFIYVLKFIFLIVYINKLNIFTKNLKTNRNYERFRKSTFIQNGAVW